MADYNSRYTGAEIEAAIARTEKIDEFAVVWEGTPTAGDVTLASLPMNPDTGDRTGIYYVVLSRTNQPAGQPNEPTYISMVGVISENGYAVGTAHNRNSATDTRSHEAVCHSAAFSGHEYIHTYSDDSFQNNPLYIHKIYRVQSPV